MLDGKESDEIISFVGNQSKGGCDGGRTFAAPGNGLACCPATTISQLVK